MTHVNAHLTPTDWLRMSSRHLDVGVPKAHVAPEFRVSRPTVATYLGSGEARLTDRPSVPHESLTRTPAAVVELIETLRRNTSGRHGASTITWSTAPW